MFYGEIPRRAITDWSKENGVVHPIRATVVPDSPGMSRYPRAKGSVKVSWWLSRMMRWSVWVRRSSCRFSARAQRAVFVRAAEALVDNDGFERAALPGSEAADGEGERHGHSEALATGNEVDAGGGSATGSRPCRAGPCGSMKWSTSNRSSADRRAAVDGSGTRCELSSGQGRPLRLAEVITRANFSVPAPLLVSIPRGSHRRRLGPKGLAGRPRGTWPNRRRSYRGVARLRR